MILPPMHVDKRQKEFNTAALEQTHRGLQEMIIKAQLSGAPGITHPKCPICKKDLFIKVITILPIGGQPTMRIKVVCPECEIVFRLPDQFPWEAK